MSGRRALVVAFALALLTLGATSFATAEVVQKGHLRVAFSGEFSPRALPRQGAASPAPNAAARSSSPSDWGFVTGIDLMTIASVLNRACKAK